MHPTRLIFMLLLFFMEVSIQAEQISIVFLSGLAELHGAQLAKDRSDLPPFASLIKKFRNHLSQILFFHGGNALPPSVLSIVETKGLTW